MSKNLTFSSALALCAASALCLATEMARASTVTQATLTFVKSNVPDNFDDNLEVPDKNINSPALYNVTQIAGDDLEEKFQTTTFERSGPGSIDYTVLFELGDGSISFDPSVPAADGMLYPHYLLISYFFVDTEFGDGEGFENEIVATFEVEEPVIPTGTLYEIAGCNPGPCTINLTDTVLGEAGRIPSVLSVSIYNTATVIPLPPAALLFGSALAAVAFGSRRRKAKA